MSENILDYIENSWDGCIKENITDDDTLIGLPYPYTVPAVGYFDEMYYWDTYFTNKGLEVSERWPQAKNNTDNMLYLVNKYGYMPNGNRTYYLKNSQPPFLSLMVRDVYDRYKDAVWLRGAYSALETEYKFWTEKRSTPTGLCRYGGTLDAGSDRAMAEDFKRRTGFMPEGSEHDIASHYLLTCESGWDVNPRWDTEGYNYAPVELNSLLFAFESNMAYFAHELNSGDDELWTHRAEIRKELMIKLMRDNEGLYYDYNFKSKKINNILSAAAFFPMFAGLAEEKDAAGLVSNIKRLEAEHGILTCEKNKAAGSYQWDYPNGWACLQYVSIMGLNRYGYKDIAKRIAKKYLALVENVFNETGNLWEKYNVVEGNINVSNEYEMPSMMGWTAGVYLALKKFVEADCLNK